MTIEMTAEEYQEAVKQQPKRGKFGNKRTTVDGITFHSQAEARHYEQLRDAQQGGAISELRLQPRYRIEVNGMKICTYVGDFEFRDASGALVVQDVKGAVTQVYRIKRALMRACLGIEVEEVGVR